MEEQTKNHLLLSMLGSILGKAPNGKDGIFPHEYVRCALERYKDCKLWREVLIGKLNSQGWRTIEDGSFEIEQAKKYNENAKRVETEFPESAKLLRLLSDNYTNQGKSDQLLSEIGISAW